MRRRLGALLVAIVFAAVLLSFLVFTQQQAAVLRRDAEVLTELYAHTYRASIAQGTEIERQASARALLTVLGELRRLQIPVVTTDTLGRPIDTAHLPFEVREGIAADSARLLRFIRDLDEAKPPLELYEEEGLAVHFGEPRFLRRLRVIPWLQAAALLAVVGGGAWMVFTSFRSERERIWSAMARESAHQMGTPLSSLVGWLEVLETRVRPPSPEPGEPDLIDQMAADVQRLQKVSRRFELIGLKPDLEPVSVGRIVEHLRRYFSARLPSLGSAVRFEIDIPADEPVVLGNRTLLEWAFENLIKNSIDAMAGQDGVIRVAYLGPHGARSLYQVHDTGPGVPAHIRDKVFEIGVTTKERGWGVGLSLTRRIIEDMHGGSIQLESSTEGASFRLELPVARNA